MTLSQFSPPPQTLIWADDLYALPSAAASASVQSERELQGCGPPGKNGKGDEEDVCRWHVNPDVQQRWQ